MTCYFIIYNVKLGQCIGVLPDQNMDYAMLVDCGHDNEFHPIDDFARFLPSTGGLKPKPSLRSLVLTNYDHDHFDGLPYLYTTTKIESVLLPKNLSMDQIWAMKPVATAALNTLAHIRSTYVHDMTNYSPPFTRQVFSLTQLELLASGIPITTNHLSQMVFVQYGETTICMPGDLEERSWELMLAKPSVQSWLRQTDVLVAPHHGRWNGYHEDIFYFCEPTCVILSDKAIVHGTQEDMASLYAKHVRGDGIVFTPATGNPVWRKTLTTRNDGHIIITVPPVGSPDFHAYRL